MRIGEFKGGSWHEVVKLEEQWIVLRPVPDRAQRERTQA